jgi:hypothetical protein
MSKGWAWSSEDTQDAVSQSLFTLAQSVGLDSAARIAEK